MSGAVISINEYVLPGVMKTVKMLQMVLYANSGYIKNVLM
jgi:hypothetical protein